MTHALGGAGPLRAGWSVARQLSESKLRGLQVRGAHWQPEASGRGPQAVVGWAAPGSAVTVGRTERAYWPDRLRPDAVPGFKFPVGVRLPCQRRARPARGPGGGEPDGEA